MTIGSDGIRGYTDLIILSLLRQNDSYGYEVSLHIRERTEGAYTMKETTLYSAFTRMEKNGWLTSYRGGETRGRQRTYYRITPLGESYYREKCVEWKNTKKIVDEFMKEVSAPCLQSKLI